MCEVAPPLSRRVLLGMLAGTTGLAMLPLRARAGAVQALGLSCIDYRLVQHTVRFFDSLGLCKDYDTLSLAGASLAAVSPKFPSANTAFWDQLAIAKELHQIQRVVVVDHRDCGAYKVAFGERYASDPDEETAQHRTVMEALKTALVQMHPDLAPEFYLMALDGKTERVL